MFGNHTLPRKPGLELPTHTVTDTQRNCEWCGGFYKPRQESQRTCGDKCGGHRSNAKTAEKKGKVLTWRSCARCLSTYLEPEALCRNCREKPIRALDAGEACPQKARFIEELLAKLGRPLRRVEPTAVPVAEVTEVRVG